ncbi:hypothetical protein [Microbacterium sp. P02]|uniref:hypothetical protein n=1 Tax=Microbacterium sp. P02 TaxID=3366260 RepID=UPI00367064D6
MTTTTGGQASDLLAGLHVEDLTVDQRLEHAKVSVLMAISEQLFLIRTAGIHPDRDDDKRAWRGHQIS